MINRYLFRLMFFGFNEKAFHGRNLVSSLVLYAKIRNKELSGRSIDETNTF